MILVQGSSRSDGNTSKVSDEIRQLTDCEFIDLGEYPLKEFSYSGPGEDDFQEIISKIVLHKEVIFITPIYWYSMSAKMKIFLDRISELLKWNKDLGRKLRGMKFYAVSVSMHDDPPEHYAYPFKMTADYLGMHFCGYCHTWIENDLVTEKSINRLNSLFDAQNS